MSWLSRALRPGAEVRPLPAKGVDISYSDTDNFQRNMVSVRTVTTTMGASCGSYALMYRRQPAVRTAVDFLARNIGQLNPKVYERVSDSERLEVSDHPLAQLLRFPNPDTTRYAHLHGTVSDLAVYNRAYWRKFRRGDRFAVVRVSPAHLSEDVTQDGQRVYRLPNGSTVPRSQLVVFPGYSPDGSGDGVSPLETLRQVLQEESSAVAHRAGMWMNSARQSGFIERPADAPEWSELARERFRADLESTLTGGHNAGRIGVLEEGMTWNASSFSPEQTQYIEGRRLTYEEVAVVYGIPPTVLGMGPDTGAHADQAHRQVYQDVLAPWLRMLQDEIELQLLPEFDPFGRGNAYVEFNLAEKLRGSFEEQGKSLVTAVGVPYMTVNEGRARLNLPSIDETWADAPVQPLNVLYGGQPAVTVPTADPGTASAGPPRTKAAPAAALERRDRAAKAHTDFFVSYFDRQGKALLAKAAPDRERWDRELTADLYALGTETARESGNLAAKQIGGVYDEERTYAYLAENARIVAEGVNAHTFDLLDEAADADARAAVFTDAKGARAEQLGRGRATMLIAFSRDEAAKHSTARDGKKRTKTWVVSNTRKSRHPHMNGQTVPAGELFSNGMRYPHDGQNGGVSEVADCRCMLQLGSVSTS